MTHEVKSAELVRFLEECESWLQNEGVLQDGVDEPHFKLAADRIQELEAEVQELRMQSIADFGQYQDALDQLSEVHAGSHCIVPVEPTEEMLLALYGSYISDEIAKKSCLDAYRTMISATKETV